MLIAFPVTSARQWARVSAIALAYCLWVGLVVGFRGDHVFLIGLCLACWSLSAHTRRLINGFFVFVVYWVVYDSMRIYPNYLVNAVHIGDLYELEKSLFGMQTAAGLITPNELFGLYNTPALDIMAGLFYINWVPVPLAFAVYLFYKNKPLFLRFSFSFVLANFIGFILYYVYPAAPPWFVSEYGMEFLPGTPSNPGRLIRFDEITGLNLFQSIYSKNANIFAAMPSLHSAYPVILLYYGLKSRVGWMNLVFAIFLLGIWFTAVYTNHHYVLDVIGGAACAVVSVCLFEWLFHKPQVQKWFTAFSKRI